MFIFNIYRNIFQYNYILTSLVLIPPPVSLDGISSSDCCYWSHVQKKEEGLQEMMPAVQPFTGCLRTAYRTTGLPQMRTVYIAMMQINRKKIQIKKDAMPYHHPFHNE